MHLAARNKHWNELRILTEVSHNSHLLVDIITEQNPCGDSGFRGLLYNNKELAKFLINNLVALDRLNILSKVPIVQVKSLLEIISFTSSEAKQMATTPGTDGNTILHIYAIKNDYIGTQKFLALLSDEDRANALHFNNRLKKSPRKLAQQTRMKSLLAWAKKQNGHYYLPKPPEIIILCGTIGREGAELECDSLEQVLKHFQLQPTVWKDLTADDMLVKILTAASKEDSSGLMVVVTGHGKKGAIYVKDGDLRFQDILSAMCNPATNEKPKILLVQSCQVQEASNSVRLSDHKSDKGSKYDPAPSAENKRVQPNLRPDDCAMIEKILKQFNAENGAMEELPKELFKALIPENAPKEERARVWRTSSDFLASLKLFHASFRGQKKDAVTCRSSDTDQTHYDLLQRDIISIMATVNGGIARRGKLIPTFADHLRKADVNDSLYSVFLKTHEELAREIPEQVLEFRSTLTKKLCLRNITDCPAHQNGGVSNGRFDTIQSGFKNLFRRTL